MFTARSTVGTAYDDYLDETHYIIRVDVYAPNGEFAYSRPLKCWTRKPRQFEIDNFERDVLAAANA